MNSPLLSPFSAYVLRLVATTSARWLRMIEIRPLFNPHPPERLTEQFRALLPRLMMPDEEGAMKTMSPKLMAILSDLRGRDPDTYTGNAYRPLMEAGILPRGGPWGLVRGVAECTPRDEISNRTRWALQMLLVHYLIHFGPPAPTESFLYVWHDTAFQFAGQSRTIGKLAWAFIQITPANALGEWVACKAIYVTNQPDGKIPVYGVPLRMQIDLASRFLYE